MKESVKPPQSPSAPTEAQGLKKLVANFSTLTLGELLSRLFTFAAFVYLARILGPEHFGYLEFTLALMVFMTLLVDFGSSPYGAREIARNPERAGTLISDIALLRIVMAVFGYLLLVVVAFSVSEQNPQVRALILLYGLTLFALPGFLQWIFQGFEAMRRVALGSILRQFIFAAGVLIFVRQAADLLMVPFIECAAVAGFVIYNVVVLKSRFAHVKVPRKAGSLKRSFLQSMPIGCSELTWAATWYIATILLGFMVGGKAVGWFSAAHRPVMTLHTFVWLYFFNLLPSMSRCSRRPPEVLRHLVDRSVAVTTWFGVFLATAGMLLAEPVMNLVYGSQYSQTISTFQILIWILPVALLSGHFRYALIACNRQKFEFAASACSALTCALLCVVMIPEFGGRGAAIALLAATLVNFILAYVFVQSKIGRMPFLSHVGRPLVAAGGMVAGFVLLHPLNIWWAVLGSLMVFGLVVLLLQPALLRTHPLKST